MYIKLFEKGTLEYAEAIRNAAYKLNLLGDIGLATKYSEEYLETIEEYKNRDPEKYLDSLVLAIGTGILATGENRIKKTLFCHRFLC